VVTLTPSHPIKKGVKFRPLRQLPTKKGKNQIPLLLPPLGFGTSLGLPRQRADGTTKREEEKGEQIGSWPFPHTQKRGAKWGRGKGQQAFYIVFGTNALWIVQPSVKTLFWVTFWGLAFQPLTLDTSMAFVFPAKPLPLFQQARRPSPNPSFFIQIQSSKKFF
jgi:hypothetical protein